MREVKFRAKVKGGNYWVYGYYVKDNYGDHFIATGESDMGWLRTITVIPETVGQYTGCIDKNNKEIYDNDILKNKYGMITNVKWDDDFLTYFPCSVEIRGDSNWDDRKEFEIIGNIFDNPELLKGEK